MSDANEDMPNQASNSPSTAEGTFAGLRIETQVRHLPLGKSLTETVRPDLLIISADLRNHGEISMLEKLIELITGSKQIHRSEGNKHVAYLDDQREWLHLARQKDMWSSSDRLVAVVHPDDSHSLLILENTKYGLRLDPQGKWSEIDDELVELTVEWALANIPSPLGKTLGWDIQPSPDRNIG